MMMCACRGRVNVRASMFRSESRKVSLSRQPGAGSRLIGDGIAARGCLRWSAFVNFEWAEGYRPEFGLIAVDRAAGFRREPKPSAYAFQRVAESGDLSRRCEVVRGNLTASRNTLG
ncbi:hypothetical protein GCM10022245_30650 [Streptomyces mayteni]